MINLFFEQFTVLRNSLTDAKKLKNKIKQIPKIEKQLEKLDSKIDQIDDENWKIKEEISKIDPKIDSLLDKLKDSEYWYNALKSKRNAEKTANEFAKEIGLASEAAKLSLYESFTNYCNMISSNLGWIWPRLYERSDLKRIELQTSIKETEEGGIKIDQVVVVSHDSAFLNAIDPEAIKHQCIKNSEGFYEVAKIS
jgi:predicted RNase H-like nuclease (RuvC/YqgF family)